MVLCDPNDDETVLVLPSGKKTHSAYIEEIVLEMIPCVSHAFVCGSHHDFLVTLLSLKLNPDMGCLLLGEEALQLARECGSKATTCVTARPCKAFRAALGQLLAKVNTLIPEEERKIRRFTVLLQDFSHETGLLRRDDGRLNRAMIKKRHQHHIDSLLHDPITENGWTIAVPEMDGARDRHLVMPEGEWLAQKAGGAPTPAVVHGKKSNRFARGYDKARLRGGMAGGSVLGGHQAEKSIEEKIMEARASRDNSTMSCSLNGSWVGCGDSQLDDDACLDSSSKMLDFSNLRKSLRHFSPSPAPKPASAAGGGAASSDILSPSDPSSALSPHTAAFCSMMARGDKIKIGGTAIAERTRSKMISNSRPQGLKQAKEVAVGSEEPISKRRRGGEKEEVVTLPTFPKLFVSPEPKRQSPPPSAAVSAESHGHQNHRHHRQNSAPSPNTPSGGSARPRATAAALRSSVRGLKTNNKGGRLSTGSAPPSQPIPPPRRSSSSSSSQIGQAFPNLPANLGLSAPPLPPSPPTQRPPAPAPPKRIKIHDLQVTSPTPEDDFSRPEISPPFRAAYSIKGNQRDQNSSLSLQGEPHSKLPHKRPSPPKAAAPLAPVVPKYSTVQTRSATSYELVVDDRKTKNKKSSSVSINDGTDKAVDGSGGENGTIPAATATARAKARAAALGSAQSESSKPLEHQKGLASDKLQNGIAQVGHGAAAVGGGRVSAMLCGNGLIAGDGVIGGEQHGSAAEAPVEAGGAWKDWEECEPHSDGKKGGAGDVGKMGGRGKRGRWSFGWTEGGGEGGGGGGGGGKETKRARWSLGGIGSLGGMLTRKSTRSSASKEHEQAWGKLMMDSPSSTRSCNIGDATVGSVDRSSKRRSVGSALAGILGMMTPRGENSSSNNTPSSGSKRKRGSSTPASKLCLFASPFGGSSKRFGSPSEGEAAELREAASGRKGGATKGRKALESLTNNRSSSSSSNKTHTLATTYVPADLAAFYKPSEYAAMMEGKHAGARGVAGQ